MARVDRWAWIEGVQREPLERALVREAGRLIAGELDAWPPAVRFADDADAARLAPVLGAASPAPSPEAFAVAFALAADVVRRDFDARDARLRGQVMALPEPERAAARAVADYLVEWLFDLAERAESRLGRPRLLEALADAEHDLGKRRAARS